MRKAYALLSVLLVTAGLKGQINNPLFIGSCDNDQMSDAVQQGSYIYGIGTTYGFGATAGDIYLFKADTSGNRIWSKRLSTGADVDAGISIAVHNNKIVITSSIPHENGTVMVSWLDTSGTLLQSMVLNDPGCSALSVCQNSAGGALISGLLVTPGNYSPFVLSTNASGDITWSKILTGTSTSDSTAGNGLGTSVVELNDGSVLVAGSRMKNGTVLPFIARLDAGGNLLWHRSYNMPCLDVTGNMLVNPAGEIIISGTCPRSTGTGADPFILKTTATGNPVFSYTYRIDETAGASTTMAKVHLALSGSHLLLTGTIASSMAASDKDCFALYLDANGNIEWAKRYGNATGNVGSCGFINTSNILLAGYSPENEPGNAIVGYAQQDLMLLSIKNDGTSPINSNDLVMTAAAFMADTVNNGLAVNDYIFSATAFSPLWYSEQSTYDSLSCFGLAVNHIPGMDISMQVYPNPATTYTEVIVGNVSSFDLYVHNAIGKLVVSQNNIVNGKALVNVNGLEPGIYLITAKTYDRVLGTQRLVVN